MRSCKSIQTQSDFVLVSIYLKHKLKFNIKVTINQTNYTL